MKNITKDNKKNSSSLNTFHLKNQPSTNLKVPVVAKRKDSGFLTKTHDKNNMKVITTASNSVFPSSPINKSTKTPENYENRLVFVSKTASNVEDYIAIPSEKNFLILNEVSNAASRTCLNKSKMEINIEECSTRRKERSLSPTKPFESVNTAVIRVISRFRPLNSVELELSQKNLGSLCSKFISDDTVTITNNLNSKQNFTLDRIFDSNTTQLDLYEQVARSTIDDVLKGYNGTIFTYGQSGSGKTHSMYGTDLYDQESKGVIPRSVEEIFNFINDEYNSEIKFELKFSMLEIYKENLYDLLNPNTKASELKIKEHPQKGIYVMNLTEEYISSEDEFLLLIENADEHRVVSETGLNKASSRSHLLFKLEIIQKLPDDTERRGILNLIDLAGSEKITKTHAVGETLEEAKKINLSLSTLGNVIKTLTSAKGEFVPYRDSKLTRILQDSLGGNYKTTLIVTCSPHIYNCEETISTLKFAARAKKIKNNVKINIKRSVVQLENIIDSLTKQLNNANNEISRFKNTVTQQFNFNNNEAVNININQNENGDIMNESKLNYSGFRSTANSRRGSRKNALTQNESGKFMPEVSNYLQMIKIKDEEILNLQDKVESLQDENKTIQEQLSKVSKETGYVYFYEILTNLQNFTKKNIDDMKNMNLISNPENNLIDQLKLENEQLKQNYQNLEYKYFKSVKELENIIYNQKQQDEYENNYLFTKKTETDKSFNSFNKNISDQSLISFNFEEEFAKYQLNFSKFFDTTQNTSSKSYKLIFNNSKMYVNSLLKEFIKKKDMFGSKYGTDKQLLYLDYLNKRDTLNLNDTNALKKEYLEMKSSFMKMNYLVVYYERIIFDVMNRVLVDIKKLEIETTNRIDIEKKCQNFNKSLMLYLELLDDMKEMKAMNDEMNENNEQRRSSRIASIKSENNNNNEDVNYNIYKRKPTIPSGLKLNIQKTKNEEIILNRFGININNFNKKNNEKGIGTDNDNFSEKDNLLEKNEFKNEENINTNNDENINNFKENKNLNKTNTENQNQGFNLENKIQPDINVNITPIKREEKLDSKDIDSEEDDFLISETDQEQADMEFQKKNRFKKNLNFLQSMNFLRQDTIKLNYDENLKMPRLNFFKDNNSEKIPVHNTAASLLIPNGSHGLIKEPKDRAHTNTNIIIPVFKKNSSRLMNNLGIFFNKLVQIEGFSNNTLNSVNNNYPAAFNHFGSLIETFTSNVIAEDQESEKIIPREKANSKKHKGYNLLRESIVSSKKLIGGCDNYTSNIWDLLFEIKGLKKELTLYKTTIQNLSGELDYLRNNNLSVEKIITEFQENQKIILDSEIENLAHVLKIYKCLYDEELGGKRKVIEELIKIIDDLYLK